MMEQGPSRGAGQARDSRRDLEILIGALPQWVWTNLPDGHCDYAGPQWQAYAGPAAVVDDGALPWMGCLHPADAARVRAEWQHALEDGNTCEQQLRLRRHDGIYRWFRLRAIPMRAEDGVLHRWFGTCSDIDELKQAEAALHDERERLDRVVQTAPSIVHTYRRNADGHASFPFGSERIAQLFELPAEAVRLDASLLLQRIDPSVHEEIERTVEESANGMQPWFAQFRIVTPRRGESWIEVHSMPVPDGDGGVDWHGSLSDVTQRKAAEQALFESQAQLQTLTQRLEERVRERTIELEAANRELEAFSYTVSHDLRAPLRAMEGFSQVLQRDFASRLDSEGQRYAGIIRDSARAMSQLIDDLLAFARLGRRPLVRRRVSMQGLVGEVVRQLQSMQPERAASWRVGDLPDCDGDLGMLRQVWTNLLSNALKYSRPREQALIEIGARDGNHGQEYWVRDNGIGFDMANADRLFSVFERLHPDEEFEGHGVGLALVQRIVLRHGGRVRAESVPGHGATFSFSLGERRDPSAGA